MADSASIWIGPADEEHIAALARLRRAFWDDQIAKGLRETPAGSSEQDIRQLIGRARTHLIAATAAGETVGYLLGVTRMVPGSTPIRISSVEEVFLSPAARRLGLAERLVAEATARFRADNADRVQLRVLAQNDEAHGFWRRLGFEPYITTYEHVA